ncbi:MAG: inositol monophosphatase family protein [Planctomycetota bacterium]|nr:inositol monophosphatase family protein [Planctomycetota bacterium]
MQRETLEAALELATAAARAAGERALAWFRDPSVAAEEKADGTLVTRADTEAEATAREVLQASKLLGEVEILGEEGGLQETGAEYRWVVDPLDGTLSFVRGIPHFGTLIALVTQGDGGDLPLVGVLHLPALGETYGAARGLGAWCDGRPVRVSGRQTLTGALLAVQDPDRMREGGLGAIHAELLAEIDLLRGYSDCFGHALALRGAVDVVLDAALHPWDLRASQVLVEEAGGRHRTWPSRKNGTENVVLGTPALVDALANRIEA